MYITDQNDGIFVSGHGVLSIRRLAEGSEHIRPDIVATSLAKINRYAGNSTVPWNDAEHSLLVADLTQLHALEHGRIKEEFPPPVAKMPSMPCMHRLWAYIFRHPETVSKFKRLCYHWGLLHDVVEVVVGDTPNPVKKYEEVSGQTRGDSAEDQIIARFKHQQLGRYIDEFLPRDEYSVEHIDTFHRHMNRLLQLVVKSADKLALLVEMANLHEPEVLSYVFKGWDVPEGTQRWAQTYQWPRLNTQVGYDCLGWHQSANLWKRRLEQSNRRLDTAFNI